METVTEDHTGQNAENRLWGAQAQQMYLYNTTVLKAQGTPRKMGAERL